MGADDIFRSVEEIPPLPASAARLLALSGEPDHTIADEVEVIETDAALTAAVLRAANSAAAGRAQPVASLRDAVAYLGERTVLGVALARCAPGVFQAELGGYAAEAGALWTHGLYTALAARRIAERGQPAPAPGVAFTAGILHDVGKAVLSIYLDGRVPAIVARLDAGEADDYLAAEREIAGVDHAEVGGRLLERWGLPEPLVAAAAFHHRPAEAPEAEQPLVYAIHLGDMVAMMHGDGTGADTLRYPIATGYETFYPLRNADLEALFLETQIEGERLAGMLAGSGDGMT